MNETSSQWPRKVLVVDDDEVHLAVVESWLASAGLDVVTHNGPRGTSKLVFQERPAIVILDLVMPELHGDVLARLLSPTWRELGVRLIFYTGKDLATVPAPSAELPVLGIMQKTSDGETFLRRFSELVARSGSDRSRTSDRRAGVD